MPKSRSAAAALATQPADAANIQLLSHNLPVVQFHHLLHMALCCYSRATNASGLTQTTQWSSRDYRGAPLTSTQQHAQGPQERSGITGQEQSPQFGLHSNHQTNSVPGDVLIGLLTNYGLRTVLCLALGQAAVSRISACWQIQNSSHSTLNNCAYPDYLAQSQCQAF